MEIRHRADADLPELIGLAKGVHQLDDYPTYLPNGDLRAFLISHDQIMSWVAEDDGLIVGHVALHRHSSRPVMELASTSLDLPEDGLGVIARLLVAPMSRRTGVGRHLLDAASTEARELGLWPVLDVLTRYEGANAFYDRCGWTRVGDVMVTLRDDTRFEEAVYVAPDLHRGG